MNNKIFFGFVFLFLLLPSVLAVDADSNEGGDVVIATIILLPMVLGWFFLRGAETMNEEHGILKIFLFLFCLLSFFISLWFGMVSLIKFYSFTELQDAIGTTTLVTGGVYIMIVSYFILYAIFKIVESVKKQKKERFEY